MNDYTSQTPQEALEAKLTALLLGELAQQEAEVLQAAIAQDPELSKLCDRLKLTTDLLRQTVIDPTAPSEVHPSSLHLAEERRQKLLQHFKTVAPKEFSRSRRRKPHWAVPMSIAAAFVVAIGLALFWNNLRPRRPHNLTPLSQATALRPPDTLSLDSLDEKASSGDRDHQSPFSDLASPLTSHSAAYSVGGFVHEPAITGEAPAANRTLSPWNAESGRKAATTIVLPPVSEVADAGNPSPGKESSLEAGYRALDEAGVGRKDAASTKKEPALAPDRRAGGQAELATAGSRNEREMFMKRYGLARSKSMADQPTLTDGFGVGGGAGGPANAPTEKTELGTVGLVDANKGQTVPGQTVLQNGEDRSRQLARKEELAETQQQLGVPFQVSAPSTVSEPAQLPALGDVPILGKSFRAKLTTSDNYDQSFTFPLASMGATNLLSYTWSANAVANFGRESENLIAPTGTTQSTTTQLAFSDTLSGKPDSYFFSQAADPRSFTPDGAQLARATNESIVLPTLKAQIEPAHEEKAAKQQAFDANTGRAMGERQEQTKQEVSVPQQRLAEQEKQVALVKSELDRVSSSDKEVADAAVRKPASGALVPQPDVATRENAFSTFSLNVSDVSFKLAAASLEKGQMPDASTIRSEEFINAFDYRDPEAAPGVPVAFAWERARYPFAQNRDVLRFSLKTAALGRQPGRPLNLVLLLDNSGSMERADRVSIIREALKVLAAQLQLQDKLSIVTFARTARLFVDGVPGNQAGPAVEEVSKLTPEGGTNLEEAMNLAYQTALRNYLANGVNRVVLLTDGAANLGEVEPEALKQKVETNRKQGVALDCFGIGWEGFNDDLLEVLSRNGDGRYGFINSPDEAASEFAGQLAGALHVAASDVKVQVEFNPARVTSYRQIGYARHQLTKEQFRDNTVDAAEIGAAESGNALYVAEVNPGGSGLLATVRIRYRVPGAADYREHEWVVPYTGNAVPLEQASPALRLATTASAFSEWLASSPYAGDVTPDRLLGYLAGVPEIYGADARPKKLEWMIRQAKSITGK